MSEEEGERACVLVQICMHGRSAEGLQPAKLATHANMHSRARIWRLKVSDSGAGGAPPSAHRWCLPELPDRSSRHYETPDLGMCSGIAKGRVFPRLLDPEACRSIFNLRKAGHVRLSPICVAYRRSVWRVVGNIVFSAVYNLSPEVYSA